MLRSSIAWSPLFLLLAATPSHAVLPCGLDGGALDVVGLTADQRLVCFAENAPAEADTLGTITGLIIDTRILGIDFRPATGELYGLGDAGGLYVLDRGAVAILQSRLDVALDGTGFAIDFNPTVDRLRVVSNTGQNLRVNVINGLTSVDTVLSYTAGTPARNIAGAAYTNNDTNPLTATTLFDLDAGLAQIAIQAPANAGSLSATGKLLVAVDGPAGFDIYSRQNGGRTVGNTGFASLAAGDRTDFYRVDLLTGRAVRRGTFRPFDEVIDIAVPLQQ